MLTANLVILLGTGRGAERGALTPRAQSDGQVARHTRSPAALRQSRQCTPLSCSSEEGWLNAASVQQGNVCYLQCRPADSARCTCQLACGIATDYTIPQLCALLIGSGGARWLQAAAEQRARRRLGRVAPQAALCASGALRDAAIKELCQKDAQGPCGEGAPLGMPSPAALGPGSSRCWCFKRVDTPKSAMHAGAGDGASRRRRRRQLPPLLC